MSDKYVAFENFKFGLDTRKSELTSVPGTLLTLQNAHINQGGEVEQRKSFVKDARPYPAFSFGLEETEDGPVTFLARPLAYPVFSRRRSNSVALLSFGLVHTLFSVGDVVTVSGEGGTGYNGTFTVTGISGDDILYASVGPDEGITVGTGTVTSLLPDSVIGQLLMYPSYSFLVVGNELHGPATSVWLTSITFSTNFLGKAFVIAKFADNSQFLYYDGTLLLESSTGIVIPNSTGINPNAQAIALAAEINDELGPDWTATASANTVTITTPTSLYFTLVVTKTSAAGDISFVPGTKDGYGTNPVSAQAGFSVTNGAAGTDTFTLSAFSNKAGTVAVDLCNGPVTCVATANLTAQAIVDAVNAQTGATGYSASINSNSVYINAPISFGNVTFNLSVTTTGTADSGAPGAGPALRATASPTTVTGVSQEGFPGHQITQKVTATATGGSGAYSYLWQECAADGTALAPGSTASGIAIDSPTNAVTRFSSNIASVNVVLRGYFKCVVTDAIATTASTNVVAVSMRKAPG